ncbi:hypothetical protein Q5425_03070 [Amycolatopsis sp. A133]|uniref:hypothetical protein n=1 Tax=Amycolatopsis sp. A133 TaxID=3064472 RepID=UPI0027F4B0FD|nr:hypothetical protein [Amycolatopsis sp. A133]MDQ7802696.1 hypothetical protein [Amycolatopsis sp. A133]
MDNEKRDSAGGRSFMWTRNKLAMVAGLVLFALGVVDVPIFHSASGVLTVIGFLLVAHQVVVNWLLLRDAIQEGVDGVVSQNPLDAPTPKAPERDYLINLLVEGYERFHGIDPVVATSLLLRPSEYTYRVNEEYEPQELMTRQTTTRYLVLPKTHRNADAPQKNLLPIAKVRKGALLDDFQASINQKHAVTVSHDHYLHFAAYLLLFLRLSEETGDDVPDRGAPGARNWMDTLLAEPKVLDDLIKGLARIAAPAKIAKQYRSEGETGVSPSDALIEMLTGSYLLLAEVEERGGAPLCVSLTRSLSSPSALKLAESRSARRRNEWRFRMGVFPASLDISTSLMYEAQSYHLSIRLPGDLFAAEHRIAKSVDGKLVDLYFEDFVAGTKFAECGPRNSDGAPQVSVHNVVDESPPYLRRRDMRAEPYSHFYARNPYKLNKIDHKHVIYIEESPFATLRLASTLGVLCFLGVIVAGVAITTRIATGAPGEVLGGTVVALIVSVPGILASWSRQAFGVEALRRACLVTQFSLRATSLFSAIGLVLALFQDVGLFRWPVNPMLKLLDRQWAIPIHDWWWLALMLSSTCVGIFAYYRYLERRAQYIQRRRRSIRVKPAS